VIKAQACYLYRDGSLMEDQTDLKEGLEESLEIREMHQNY